MVEWSPRRRVVLDPAIPCGRCAYASPGRPSLPRLRFAGHGYDRRRAGARSTGRNDSPIRCRTRSPTKPPLLEPLGVALHALDLGRVQPGTSAGVFGCGPIGLLLVQALRAAGVTAILATDRSTAPGRGGGGDGRDVRIPRGGGAPASVRTLPRSVGVDVAFEVAGRDGARSRTRSPRPAPAAASSCSVFLTTTARASRLEGTSQGPDDPAQPADGARATCCVRSSSPSPDASSSVRY